MTALRITIISVVISIWLHGCCYCGPLLAEGSIIIPQQQQQWRSSCTDDQGVHTPFIAHTVTTRQSFLQDVSSWFGVVVALSSDVILLSPPDACHAATTMVETIGKDPNCNDATCLGVWDGLLANCDHNLNPLSTTAGCVSSQDDTPGTFAEPWDYSDDVTISTTLQEEVPMIMDRIIYAIQSISNTRNDKVDILLRDQRYLHVLFTDGRSGEISDGEFYITPNDTTIQFRISSTLTTNNDMIMNTNVDSSGKQPRRPFTFMKQSLKNIDRAELIRKELRWLKLPILRNRQRVLFFVESNLDTFGPQSAALGPPEEMKINDINGN